MSGETFPIRPANPTDLAGVLALYAQPELDNGNVLTPAEAQRIFDRFRRYPDYTLYVVDRGTRIVGSFALLIMDNLGHLGAPSAIVEDVVVDPLFQNRGVGRQMMQFAIEIAGEKGCYKLILSSNAKRERAHAFYESLGFERHGYSFRMNLAEAAA